MRWDDLSVYPPELPKKKEIAPTYESSKGLMDERESPSEVPIKFYKVICPRCKAQAGFPCFVNKRMGVSYTVVCIARVILYEASEISGKSWGKE